MHIQIKQFSSPQGNYMIMIARGILSVRGLEQILIKVAAAALARPNCRVLLDLIDASCTIGPREISRLFSELRPDLYPTRSRIALVSQPDDDHHASLSDVSTSLAKHGFRIAVFRDSKAAVDWLGDLP
jgi:hypothetical protein